MLQEEERVMGPTPILEHQKEFSQYLGIKEFFLTKQNSRAILIVNKKRTLLYQYIEPTFFTRRGSPEILRVLEDLKELKLI